MTSYTVCNLYSGSKGNATYISIGGVNILIDAGKSARTLVNTLASQNIDIDSIDGIFVTHEHRDHISALQTLSHKHKIPIYICLESAMCFNGLCDKDLCDCLCIQNSRDFCVKIRGVEIKAFPTPHDSRASVGYRITYHGEDETVSIGYATDIGFVSDAVRENLMGCRAVVLESNHDTDMLMNGPYPYELKLRIASERGHISNREAANFASILCENGTDSIILAHLSEENNDPTLAYDEVFSAISDKQARLLIASQNTPTLLTENYPANEKEDFGWFNLSSSPSET